MKRLALALALLVYSAGAVMAQTTPGGITAALCADNGSLLNTIITWAVNGIAVIGGSSMLSNSRTIQNIPYVGPLINLVGANWASWLRQAAENAKKATPPSK